MFYKVELKIDGGREACWIVKEALGNLFEKVDFRFRGENPPRVVLESSPEMQPVIAAGFRMLGFLERQGIQNLKPEWGRTLSIYQAMPAQRPIFLADFSIAKGWSIQEGNLGLVKPGLTAATVLAAVRT